LGTGQPIGYEALLRGREEQGPKAVLNEARRAGRLLQVDLRSLELAVTRAPRAGIVFVNVLPATFVWLARNGNLAHRLGARKPARVCIEIVEHSGIRNMDEFVDAAKAIRRMGCLLAADDIASGTDRLQLVAMLTPDYIKIERDMVHDCDRNDGQLIVIRSMVTMARKMRARVIAEGIETGEELAALRAAGIKYGQGWYLAKPAPYAGLRPVEGPRQSDRNVAGVVEC